MLNAYACESRKCSYRLSISIMGRLSSVLLRSLPSRMQSRTVDGFHPRSSSTFLPVLKLSKIVATVRKQPPGCCVGSHPWRYHQAASLESIRMRHGFALRPLLRFDLTRSANTLARYAADSLSNVNLSATSWQFASQSGGKNTGRRTNPNETEVFARLLWILLSSGSPVLAMCRSVISERRRMSHSRSSAGRTSTIWSCAPVGSRSSGDNGPFRWLGARHSLSLRPTVFS